MFMTGLIKDEAQGRNDEYCMDNAVIIIHSIYLLR